MRRHQRVTTDIQKLLLRQQREGLYRSVGKADAAAGGGGAVLIVPRCAVHRRAVAVGHHVVAHFLGQVGAHLAAARVDGVQAGRGGLLGPAAVEIRRDLIGGQALEALVRVF